MRRGIFLDQVPTIGLLRPDRVIRLAGDPDLMDAVLRSKAQGDKEEDFGGRYRYHG